MNRIQLESDDILKRFSDCRTFGELLRAVEQELALKGQVVCEIWVNDKRVDDETDPSWQGLSISAIESLKVIADQPETLIQGALSSVLQSIPTLQTASREAAQRLREGSFQQGVNGLTEVLSACQWMTETLHHARGAASGTGKSFQSAEFWLGAERHLMSSLSELGKSLENKDYSLIADLLEYDLPDALELWPELVEQELSLRI